jgi:hypothetical protein
MFGSRGEGSGTRASSVGTTLLFEGIRKVSRSSIGSSGTGRSR